MSNLAIPASVIRFSVLGLVVALLGASPLAAQTGTYTYNRNVHYGTDRLQLMDIYQPQGATAPVPVIILIHGGDWVGGGKGNVAGVAAYFAQNGYAVANINYRLVANGLNLYPTSINDVSAAIAYVKANAATYNIDPSKVAAMGSSVGSYLALEAADQGQVNALVDFYGCVDLSDPAFLANHFSGHTNATTMLTYLGSALADDPDLYAEASPLNQISATNPPTLIFHGMRDKVVPPAQSQTLCSDLEAEGVEVQLVLVQNAGHSFLESPKFNSTPYLQQTLAFLDDIFSAPPPPPASPPAPDPSLTNPTPDTNPPPTDPLDPNAQPSTNPSPADPPATNAAG